MLWAPNRITAPVTAQIKCCLLFGFPVKKLKDANPRARTAKIGRIDPRRTVFNPRSEDSTEAWATLAQKNNGIPLVQK